MKELSNTSLLVERWDKLSVLPLGAAGGGSKYLNSAKQPMLTLNWEFGGLELDVLN